MNTKPIILIGAAGTGTAFAAIVALRRVWSQTVRVIAMDINPRHLVTASLLADEFEQVTLSSNPEFSSVLIGIIERHSVNTYLPLLPVEISIAAQLIDDQRISASISVMVPPAKASIACADKLALSKLLETNGIPVPKSANGSAPFIADTLFLKPKNGSGSQGARVVESGQIAALISDEPDEWLVQEICESPEVTVDAFFDPVCKFIHVVCRERIEVKSGVSTKCRLFHDETLRDIARGIADLLVLAGSFCFQVMKCRADWVVIDINPRPGAATAMCLLTGNDFFAATFALRWGQEYRRFFKEITREHYVTRQYSEFIMGSKQHECGT